MYTQRFHKYFTGVVSISSVHHCRIYRPLRKTRQVVFPMSSSWSSFRHDQLGFFFGPLGSHWRSSPCPLRWRTLVIWKIPTINGGFVRWENHLFLWAIYTMAMLVITRGSWQPPLGSIPENRSEILGRTSSKTTMRGSRFSASCWGLLYTYIQNYTHI
jgi:hypothetical protein